jgi:hypothetical protein
MYPKPSFRETMKYKIPIKREHWPLVGFVALFAVIGTILLSSSHAATPYISLSASSGTTSGNITKKTDSTQEPYVQFGAASTGGGGGTGTAGGGANMVVGLNAGGWGPSGAQKVSTAVKYMRLDSPSNEAISDFANVGVKVDLDFSGPYNTSGVSALNPTSWANNALSYYKSSGCTTTECPMLEVLNEPGGTWFWGSSAQSSTNAKAYDTLLQTTYTTFHNAYGSSAPLILASYDGGQDSSTSWGQAWYNSTVAPYVDGITMHPYGGNGAASGAKTGNRGNVTNAHNQTNKPVYVTELGWPTATSSTTPTTTNDTGDSLQWPQSNSSGTGQGDQCDNVYNFMTWARGTNYINAVYIFGYADYGTNAFYGMFDSSGNTAKPAFGALKAAANNQANPCPNPLSY